VAGRVVYVVAKAPRLGAVKTRLCPPLAPEQAVALYRGFLLDSLELAGQVPAAVARAICPDSGQADELAPLMPAGCEVTVQSEAGLSGALESCFRDGLADGYRAVAVIASDNPTLPPNLITRAFKLLTSADVVFGPADDGGYYLVAARAVYPTLFRDMTWSTSDVLAESLRRSTAAGLSVALLPPWHDVDTPAALLDLGHELDGLPPTQARHTRAVLAALEGAAAGLGAPQRVALIIPVWNEAEVIGRVLDEVPPELVDRLIVVDGGSSDETRAVASNHGAEVVVQSRRGYGAACWEGAQVAADCELLVWLDGDYSDPPADLGRLLEPLRSGRADLVLGCRDFAPGALPLHARLGNQLVLGILRLLLGRRFSDLPSFKAIRAGALAALSLEERTYGWTTEMIVKAARQGLRIAEVQVGYRERGGGRSKVSGTVRGTVGAGYKLITTAVRSARTPLAASAARRGT
jgi:rSAM/selenodomain-associated transferase 1